MRRAGVTLLETMVALVILGLVVSASLQLYASALGSASRARDWAHVVAYAEEGMERVKLDPVGSIDIGLETLPDGFRRQVQLRPVGGALSEATVTVLFPDGGSYRVSRLVWMWP